MSRKVRGILVAAIAVASLAIVAFAVVPRDGNRPMTVTAQFQDSIGLYEGNAVSVLGMPVGTVTDIVPKDSYVEVTLAIDKGVDIPADVQAVTVSTSILTDRHIELTPVYRDGPKLASGDVLGLPRTRTPVEFDRTLAMVDKLSRSLSGDGQGNGPLADLVNVGTAVTSGNGPDIKATLDELSKALRLSADNGAGSKKDIQAIVDNLAELTKASADNNAAIREFGSNLRQLSDILAEEDIGAGTTGAKINEILAHATSLLENNRDGLKGTVADAQILTTAMTDYRRELSEFFDVAPLAIDNVYNAVDTNGGAVRLHAVADKILFDSQMTKELCNLAGMKQLGCATGTLQDFGPDFGLTGMLELMAGLK